MECLAGFARCRADEMNLLEAMSMKKLPALRQQRLVTARLFSRRSNAMTDDRR